MCSNSLVRWNHKNVELHSLLLGVVANESGSRIFLNRFRNLLTVRIRSSIVKAII